MKKRKKNSDKNGGGKDVFGQAFISYLFSSKHIVRSINKERTLKNWPWEDKLNKIGKVNVFNITHLDAINKLYE